ncbi:NUDIX domain-containing protein [Allomuricauda sp. d1]|uniref:NUDIX hydrolase n=1 Tax=Allomuricauda sp. d1 TaxID=3136725 RepID=UPI0031D55417
MDELIDIWDAEGKPAGETKLKSEAHRLGLFHPTVHIWCYTLDGKVLLQKRGVQKRTFPLLWDVSVAGHVTAGEEIMDAAIRETAEEIGLKISAPDLHAVGVFKSIQKHAEDFIDAEFHHVYLCELTVPLHSLQKQENEVEALKLISLLRFAEETWGMANTQKYVPHSTGYYKKVIKEIKKKL